MFSLERAPTALEPFAMKNTFSLYLAKEGVSEFEDLLTDTARAQLDAGKGAKAASDNLGDGGVLYTFPGERRPPRWVAQFAKYFPTTTLLAQSPCAILMFRKDGRVFALTFSYGHV